MKHAQFAQKGVTLKNKKDITKGCLVDQVNEATPAMTWEDTDCNPGGLDLCKRSLIRATLMILILVFFT